MEAQLSLIECATQVIKELAAKLPAQHKDVQEEATPARNPAVAFGCDATARHQAMHVRMVTEILAPGMQDGEESDLSAKMRRIGRDLPQRFGGSAKQEVVHFILILKANRRDLARQREDHVEVLDGK